MYLYELSFPFQLVCVSCFKIIRFYLLSIHKSRALPSCEDKQNYLKQSIFYEISLYYKTQCDPPRGGLCPSKALFRGLVLIYEGNTVLKCNISHYSPALPSALFRASCHIVSITNSFNYMPCNGLEWVFFLNLLLIFTVDFVYEVRGIRRKDICRPQSSYFRDFQCNSV